MKAEKDRILEVILDGFGDYTIFNEVIRHVFQRRTVHGTQQLKTHTKKQSDIEMSIHHPKSTAFNPAILPFILQRGRRSLYESSMTWRGNVEMGMLGKKAHQPTLRVSREIPSVSVEESSPV